MKITLDQIQKHLELLDHTPRRIANLTEGVEETRLSVAREAKSWSAVEVLAHLRGCADVWAYSIYAMLSEEEPKLALLDERRWAKTAGYTGLRFGDSFQTFRMQRLELVKTLGALPPAGWSRGADIGGRRHTVFSQARRMALHEVEHCVQLEELLKPASSGMI